MKKNKKFLAGALVIPGLVIALAGCSAAGGVGTADSGETQAQTESTTESASATETRTSQAAQQDTGSGKNTVVSAAEVPDGFSERDFDTSYADAKTVELSANGAKTDAAGVTVDGNTVTFTQEGTYLLNGDLTGQIVVDLPGENDKIQLVLDGVNVTNSGSAGIYVKNADKVFVTTANGSENSVSVTGEFVQTDDNNVDGAIYSKDDIVFNGEGTLKVSCVSGHGIVSKNDLKITSGSYEITSGSKALQGKDMVGIAGGTVTLTAGTDGIDSVNVAVYGGDTNITAGDEGINSDVTDENTEPKVLLAGGTVKIDSGDDGIQTTGSAELAGANVTITAGGGSVNAAEHFGDVAFGQMGGWAGRGQGGPQFGGEPDSMGEINYDTDDDETTDDGSKNKGIKANNIILRSGSMTIDSQDDAIHADGDITAEGGTYEINAGDDGLHADATLTVNGGTFTVEGWEGLEATVVTVNDGDIFISAKDDGINAVQKVSGLAPGIEINGGSVGITMAQGDTDALDSNGSLVIRGGAVDINAQSPFDYDGEGVLSGGSVKVNGEQITELYTQLMGGGHGGMMTR